MPEPDEAKSSRRTFLYLLLVFGLFYLFFFPVGLMTGPDGKSLGSFARAVDFLFGIGRVKPEDHLHFSLLWQFCGIFTTFCCAAFIWVAALLIGKQLLRITGTSFEQKPEEWLFSAAFGFGALSLLTLGAGISIGLQRTVFIPVLVAVIVGERRWLKQFVRDCRTAIDQLEGKRQHVWLVYAGALGTILTFFAVVACYAPPLDYDVLEYHLGAPAAYFREGRISFIRYNVYSNFPFNTEMLYLLGLVVRGGILDGAAVAKLLNLQFGLLTAALLGLAGWRLFRARAGWCAAIIFLACPWFTRSAIRAYVTLPLTFYTFLTAWAFWCYLTSEKSSKEAGKWLLRFGVACGLAMGAKYTSILFLWAPAIIAVAAIGWCRKVPFHRLGKELAIAAFVPLALVSPWLLKNLIYTGNPVFPLLGSVFHGSEWDADRAFKFAAAHQAWSLGPIQMVREAGRRALTSEGSSLLLLIFLPLLIQIKQKRAAFFFLGYTILFYVLWARFTHRMDRFFVPALPALCLLAGAGFWNSARLGIRIIPAIVLAGLLLFQTYESLVIHSGLGGLQVALGLQGPGEYVRDKTKNSNYSWDAIQYLNSELKEGEKVLFVGEAQTFYCEHNDFLMATVFDRQWLDWALEAEPGHSNAGVDKASRAREAIKRLKSEGVTHLYLNWPEIFRLQQAYAYDRNGQRRPGLLFCLDSIPGPAGPRSPAEFCQQQFRSGIFSRSSLGRYLKRVKGFPSNAASFPLFGIYRIED